MAKNKTYQAISDTSLSIEVYDEKNKVSKTIVFTGGGRYPYKRLPTYNTDDKNLIKLLESHPLYGKLFKLKEANDKGGGVIIENGMLTRSELLKKIEQLQKVNADLTEKVKDLESKLKEKEEKITTVKDDNTADTPTQKGGDNADLMKVVNIQMAREYLNKYYDIPFNKMPNKTSILNKANALGVKFVNLK